MLTTRKAAIFVGILFIIGTLAGILSVMFTNPSLNAPDYLVEVAANQNQVILGVLFILVMGFSLAMIPLILFPILKRQNESLALGYVVFRGALEMVTYMMTALSMLLLLPLSQEYVSTGVPSDTHLQTLGNLLREVSKLPLTVIVFSLGALMFYTMLYQSKLIPHWLSVWGLIAIGLHLVTVPLLLFGLQTDFSTSNVVMNLPIFLQEMVMAVWLIVKGFSPSTITSVSAETDMS